MFLESDLGVRTEVPPDGRQVFGVGLDLKPEVCHGAS